MNANKDAHFERRDKLTAELSKRLKGIGKVRGEAWKIRIEWEPDVDYLDTAAALGYLEWLRGGRKGRYRVYQNPKTAVVPTQSQLALDKDRMARTLQTVRNMCMEATAQRNPLTGAFIPNSFAEKLGKIAGEGLTGMTGGDNETKRVKMAIAS